MARDLPYFKFFSSEWNDGDIALESFSAQGLFISICSYYWSNECNITLSKCKKRFKTASEEDFKCLIDSNIIKVDKDDNLLINFLIEQYFENEETLEKRRKAGKASAEARKALAISLLNTNPTHVEQVINTCDESVQLLKEKEIDIPIEKTILKDEPQNPFLESIIANQVIEPFEGQDFKEAWHAWKLKRSSMANPIRPSDEKLALKVLWEESKGDKTIAIRAIEKSIASGHSSLNPRPEPTFKPKEEQPKPRKKLDEY